MTNEQHLRNIQADILKLRGDNVEILASIASAMANAPKNEVVDRVTVNAQTLHQRDLGGIIGVQGGTFDIELETVMVSVDRQSIARRFYDVIEGGKLILRSEHIEDCITRIVP